MDKTVKLILDSKFLNKSILENKCQMPNNDNLTVKKNKIQIKKNRMEQHIFPQWT